MARYLRNIKDGFIYDWNERLAEHPLCEEVSEEVAYPERFITQSMTDRIPSKVGEALITDKIPPAPDPIPPEFHRDAGRRLGMGNTISVPETSTQLRSAQDFSPVGLRIPG